MTVGVRARGGESRRLGTEVTNAGDRVRGPRAESSRMPVPRRVTAGGERRVGADDGDGTESSEGTEGTDDGAGSGGPWITVDLTGGVTATGGITINLLGVSVEGIEVASADLPSGRYNQARIFFTDATIVFSGPVEVDGMMLAQDEDHDLEIPSGEQTGIKVQTGFFDVPAAGTETIGLYFDPANSVKNIVVNANRISMTPVIIGTVGVPEGA